MRASGNWKGKGLTSRTFVTLAFHFILKNVLNTHIPTFRTKRKPRLASLWSSGATGTRLPPTTPPLPHLPPLPVLVLAKQNFSAPRDDTARASCGNGAKRKLLSLNSPRKRYANCALTGVSLRFVCKTVGESPRLRLPSFYGNA